MKKIVCGFILLSLLLAGCVPIIATNFKLKLSPDEKWNLTTEIVLTASDAMLFGETITGFINEMNQDTEFAGLDATWETTGPDRDD
ncbi:MAG TPA: hypothetical protein PKV95_13845, partial [Anaerolineaceae bacterium]|nr:hypothetical protein [Anaerolineaceae bacterium]